MFVKLSHNENEMQNIKWKMDENDMEKSDWLKRQKPLET